MMDSLLLKNTAFGVDKNACFANSVIQLLRRVSNIRQPIVTLNADPENKIHLLLKEIFLSEGSNTKKSTSQLRKEVGERFSTGFQQDCKEFLDTLLEKLHFNFHDIFKFKIKSTKNFINENEYSTACMYCGTCEVPVESSDTTLHICIPNSQNLKLQSLIDKHFNPDPSEKKCSKCEDKPMQNYKESQQFFEPGNFLIVQLKRFSNNLQKLDHHVEGSFGISVHNNSFKIIGVIGYDSVM